MVLHMIRRSGTLWNRLLGRRSILEQPELIDHGQTLVLPFGFTSPCDTYPSMENDGARLRRYPQPASVYWSGYLHDTMWMKQQEDLVITALQTNEGDGEWRTWMVSDPAHWLMTKEYAAKLVGPNILVAGLGLGMILHALKDRRDIKTITLVDRNPHVLKLMLPLVPHDHHLTVIVADFWPWLEGIAGTIMWDSIFIDLWRGPITNNTNNVMEHALDVQRLYPFPRTAAFYFLYQQAVDLWRKQGVLK